MYLVSAWRKFPSQSFKDITFFVTCEEHCFSLHATEDFVLASSDVPELKSDHEEADTRMLLHAKHASMSYESVLVQSPDTDVFALLVSIGNDNPCHLYSTQEHRVIGAYWI